MERKYKLLIKVLTEMLFYISIIDNEDNNRKFYEIRDILNSFIMEMEE